MIPYQTLVELAVARQTQLHREADEHRIAAQVRRLRRRDRWRPSHRQIPAVGPEILGPPRAAGP